MENRNKGLIALTITAILLTGCVVPTQYEKSVAVTKDANGRIVSTTITETVVQPNQKGKPVKLENLDGVQVNPKS